MLYGSTLTAATFGAFALAHLGLGLDQQATVTVTFLTLAFSQLWHVFNMRHESSRLGLNEISRNPWIWAALALCAGILLAAAYVPSLSFMLHMVAPDIWMWGIIFAMSMVPLLVGPVIRYIVRQK
jgi:Ca2+-transporting ATPase